MTTDRQRAWSKTPDNIGGRICTGSMNCEYQTVGRNGSSRSMTCEVAWEQYQRALVESFLGANPDTWFHQRKSPCFHPARSIRSVHSNCPEQSNRVRELDHARLAKLGARQGFQDPFIINQPYAYHTDGIVWRPIDHQTLEVNLGKGRSWYFPNNSRLVVIASPDTLAKLTLEYDMPDPALRPTGCIRWDEARGRGPRGEHLDGWMPYRDGMTVALPDRDETRWADNYDEDVTSDRACQLGIHCNGNGEIELHVIQHDVLICARCAAGEEGITTWEVREQLAEREYPDEIHRAKSTGHRCW